MDSLSADQREAIAQHLCDQWPLTMGDLWVPTPAVRDRLTDTVADLFERFEAEARRDEQERADRYRAAIQRIGAARVYKDGELAKGVSVELAGAIVDALGEIEGSEATDNQGADDD